MQNDYQKITAEILNKFKEKQGHKETQSYYEEQTPSLTPHPRPKSAKSRFEITIKSQKRKKNHRDVK